MPTAAPDLIHFATVLGAHGLAGQVRVRSFTAAPADLAAYGPLTDETGKARYELQVRGIASGGRGIVLARVAGVATRAGAEAMNGLRLYARRAALPRLRAADEFYHADLVGLRAERCDGRPLGRVQAVLNFGAGDILEVVGSGGRALLLPFTSAAVPVVDVAGGRIVADPPAESAARQGERR